MWHRLSAAAAAALFVVAAPGCAGRDFGAPEDRDGEGESESEGEDKVACSPGTRFCRGPQPIDCDEDGYEVPRPECLLVQGEVCWAGECRSACEIAADSNAYLGCEYWPTVTPNALPDYRATGLSIGDFDFAVVVSNPHPVDVAVVTERGGREVSRRTVPAGDVAVVRLPWVRELAQRPADVFGESGSAVSARVAAGAYRLRSALPVAAYQFNPLQFSLDEPGVFGETLNSYSNDASLLLPTAALGTSYLAIARPSWGVFRGFGDEGYPGFFAVVATEDGTTVTARLAAHTQAGGGVPARRPGETSTFELDRGDVVVLVSAHGVPRGAMECRPTDEFGGQACVGGRDYDLTGSAIESDKPVAVFGGHYCTFVPFDRWACDHLEEQMFPLDTWSTSLVMVSTPPQVDGEPNVFKVVSGSDDNAVEFEPEVHDPVALDAGEYVEFTLSGAFRVTGTGRLAVAQFMVGEDYFGQMRPPEMGDPAMGLGIPVDQFRTGYDFLTPETYTVSTLTVIASIGTAIELDRRGLPDLTAIGETGMGFARIEMEPGAHHVQSALESSPFGIMVSGIAPYTSYLFPGGLDLRPIPLE